MSRIIENFDVLETFFALSAGEDKDQNAAGILQELRNSSTKAYLFFLKYITSKFSKFNALFQERDVLIHKLVSVCEQIFADFCYNYIQVQYIKQMDINVDQIHQKSTHTLMSKKKNCVLKSTNILLTRYIKRVPTLFCPKIKDVF